MTGNTETHPTTHINMNDAINSQNLYNNFNHVLAVKLVKGINAVNPAIHPGIHIPHSNTIIDINANFVNIPKMSHRMKGRKPVCGISSTDPFPLPMTIRETLKNLFNIIPPIS